MKERSRQGKKPQTAEADLLVNSNLWGTSWTKNLGLLFDGEIGPA
jgi:hypothetical protein